MSDAAPSLVAEAPVRCQVHDFGFQLYAFRNDRFLTLAARHGYWEWHITEFLCRRSGRGGVFVDVGANVGYYSVLMTRVLGPAGRIVAFEPHPLIRAVLERNLVLNDCSNVTVDARAVGRAAGRSGLEFDPNDSGSTYLVPGSEVETVSLDAALGDLRPDLVKVDIQGGEIDLLLGAPETVARGAAFIVEFYPAGLKRAGRDQLIAALRLLHSNGYSAHVFRAHDTFAIEPLTFDVLMAIYDHWVGIGHDGFLELLLSRSRYGG